MSKYIIKINIEREVEAEDEEDAKLVFFENLEESNQTCENLISENLTVIK